MEFQPPTGVAAMLHGNTFLSDLPKVRRQQISRINEYVRGKRSNAKETRILRNQRYKTAMNLHKMSEASLKDREENPKQLGGPRRYKIFAAGEQEHLNCELSDDSSYKHEGNSIYFAAFGVPGRPVKLNDKWVTPDGSEISRDKRCYNLSFPDQGGHHVFVYLDFTQSERPTGHIETSAGLYVIRLEEWALQYNVSVSANAGVKYAESTGFKWDPNSDTWKKASWEAQSLTFAYDVGQYDVGGDDPEFKIQVLFQDNKDGKKTFKMMANQWADYTAIMSGAVEHGSSFLTFEVTENDLVPLPPASRKDDAVKSVYAKNLLFKFDEFGFTFTGGYAAPLNRKGTSTAVYAVSGSVADDMLSRTLPQKTSQSTTEKPLFSSAVKPISTAYVGADRTSDTDKPLDVSYLLSIDPMQPDPNSPTGYSDFVSKQANEDFKQIIRYYMDPDIHELFISKSPTVLSPKVRAIATNSSKNEAFYKKLQVPYCVSALGNSTLDEAKQCNTVRAGAQLSRIPAGDPIYRNQSDALYRMRYLESFDSVKKYLDGQESKDWSSEMGTIADKLKATITKQSEGVTGDRKAYDAAIKDVDDLLQWAKDEKLFYAFSMYHKVTVTLLPQLYAQIKSTALSASVSRTIKKLSTTFGMLENGRQNRNGKSFQEAFNDMIRLWQMMAVIPQFVDIDGASTDFDSLMKSVLEQFVRDNRDSDNADMIEEVARANMLAANAAIRKDAFQWLALAMRASGSFATMGTLIEQWQLIGAGSSWVKKLGAKGPEFFASFARFAAVGLLVLPMIEARGGGWAQMSTEEKTKWIISAAGILTGFVLKGIQGVVRVYQLWNNITGFWSGFQAMAGTSRWLNSTAFASIETQNTFAGWFVRTSETAMNMGTAGGYPITTLERIFCRSAGRFIANCVGAVLAGVNLVMSIIDAVKSNSDLEKTFNAMMVISSGFQLLAIAAAWAASALVGLTFTGAATAVYLLNMVAAVAGPAAIIFAIAGLIIFLVWYFTRPKEETPTEKFIRTHAAEHKLKLDYETAIDYFNTVPADASETSLNGISFEAKVGDRSGFIKVDKVRQASEQSYTVVSSDNLTYLPDTCWCVSTDENGFTYIYTPVLDAEKKRVEVYLTEMSDGSVGAMPLKKKEERESQQFFFFTKSWAKRSSRTTDGDKEDYVTQAEFSIIRGSKVLVSAVSGGSLAIELVDKAPAQFSDKWTVTLRTMGPPDFEYYQSPWLLTTENTSEENGPRFSGTASVPLKWSIKPALPSGLKLITEGTKAGCITQIEDVPLVAMEPTTYDVTAEMSIAGRRFSKSTALTVEIKHVPSIDSDVSNTVSVSVGDDKGQSSGLSQATSGSLRARNVGKGADTSSHNDTVPSSESQQTRSTIKSAYTSTEVQEQQQSYDDLMQSVPSFFKWRQNPQTVAMNNHYTATRAIYIMQNSLQGHFSTGTYYSTDPSYESLYYSNPPTPPPVTSGDPCDYVSASAGFVAQTIYNGNPDGKDWTDWDKTIATTNTFNTALWNNNVDRYVDWLRWSDSVWTTGPQCSLSDYIAVLKSAAWLTQKKALQNSHSWSDATAEMFDHFLKLTALGASDDDIQSVFTYMTSGTDHVTINASDFPSITPTTWKSYRGYLYDTFIEYGQLSAKCNQQTMVYYTPPRGPSEHFYVGTDQAFVSDKGFSS